MAEKPPKSTSHPCGPKQTSHPCGSDMKGQNGGKKGDGKMMMGK